MPNDDRKLDREKFERALARAVELSEVGETELSAADLIDTARQLGIDERVARAALAEVEGTLREEVAQPSDTTIELEVIPERLRLAAPALGWGGVPSAIPVGIGCGLTALFFAMLFTAGYASVSLLVASFSIPFLIGFGLLTLTAETLFLGNNGGELVLKFGFLARRLPLDPRGLVCKRVEKTSHTHAHLSLVSNHRTYGFLSGRTDAELAWVEDRINRWLAQNNA